MLAYSYFVKTNYNLENILLIKAFTLKKNIEYALMAIHSVTKPILLEINSYRSLVNYTEVTIYKIFWELLIKAIFLYECFLISMEKI